RSVAATMPQCNARSRFQFDPPIINSASFNLNGFQRKFVEARQRGRRFLPVVLLKNRRQEFRLWDFVVPITRQAFGWRCCKRFVTSQSFLAPMATHRL